MIFQQIKQLSAPIMAHLEITNCCNHGCVHCYKLDSSEANRPKELVEDRTILSNFQKLIEGGILQIIITGGEPLMKKELVKKIILLAKEHNVIVSLNTNLTLADDDIIDFLRETRTRMLVSCPSAMPKTYESITLTKNHQTFETNLSKVISAGIKTAVNMVVLKDNITDIRETAKKIKQLGCTTFCITPAALNMDYPKPELLLSKKEMEQVIDDILWIESELKIKVDILDGLPKCVFPSKVLSEEHLFLYRRCQAGRSFVAVSPNGDVRVCANSSVVCGNLHRENLREIWQKMSFWRTEDVIPDDCKDCAWLNRCLGGCRTNAKTLSGKWNGIDIWKPEPIKTPSPNFAKKIDLKDDTILSVSEGIQVRKEYENVYLISCIQHRTFCMVNQPILDFVLQIQKLNSVSFSQVLKYCGKENRQKVVEIITKLIQYKILDC